MSQAVRMVGPTLPPGPGLATTPGGLKGTCPTQQPLEIPLLTELGPARTSGVRSVFCLQPGPVGVGRGRPGRGGAGGPGRGSLQVLAVVPVVLLMLAGQEVGEAVALALEQPDEVVGAVVPLLEHQLRVIHLLLRGHHLCGQWVGSAKPGWGGSTCQGSLITPDSPTDDLTAGLGQII